MKETVNEDMQSVENAVNQKEKQTKNSKGKWDRLKNFIRDLRAEMDWFAESIEHAPNPDII